MSKADVEKESQDCPRGENSPKNEGSTEVIERMIEQTAEDLKEIESDQMELQLDLMRLRYYDEFLSKQNREINKDIQELDGRISGIEERNIEKRSMVRSFLMAYEEE
ncbi:uncharacterized protein LOC123319312 [Coccinella septempunctata]|uniref:uncharacterized protein LOC123319312 n=1 Tax=Coccinella septempunctata TaxID=41139 RepID=UPI001D0668DB|nr:uncharacterized protein LOC123319312 [Coccinella septempunctata]